MKLSERIEKMLINIPQTKTWIDTFRGGSPKTIESYLSKLVIIFEELHMVEWNDVLKLNTESLNKIYDVVEQRHWDCLTANANIKNLKRFLDWAKEEGLIENNFLSKFKSARGTPKPTYVLTESEQDQLLDGILKCTKNKRMLAMTSLSLATGNRKMSILGTKIDDIKGNRLIVRDKGNKYSEHIIDEQIIAILNDYIETDRKKAMIEYVKLGGKDLGYLFVANCGENSKDNKNLLNGNKMSENSYNKQLKNIARKAGIAKWSVLKVHSLRASYGINFYHANGNDLIATQKAMGHSNSTTTAGYLMKEKSNQNGATINPFLRINAKKENANNQLEEKNNREVELEKQIAELNTTLLRQSELINKLLEKIGDK